MDSASTRRRALAEFLTVVRQRSAPEDFGFARGARRRTAGLRREEVALLAGVSSEYYIQIERGRVSGVSDEVMHAIATALRLNEVETAHLFDLTRSRRRASPRAGRAPVAAHPQSAHSGCPAAG